MSRYHVEVEAKAKKSLLALPRQIQERIISILDHLQENPRPPGAKKLTGREGYRVRSGDYRVLYTIDDSPRLVRVYVIGHRREVYR